MRLWVTGYRSYELGIFKTDDKKIEVIKYALRQLFERKLDEELEWIISGGQLGVEQWALEAALDFTKENINVKTALMYPYAEFSKNWKEDKQLKLYELEQTVDFSASVSDKPYTSPVQLRNYQRFMVEHTDQAVLLYDPEYPGKAKYDHEFLQKTAHPFELIDMYQLQDAAEQYAEQQRIDYE
ncbi:DUF1273 domain-containing protein [Ligilactobacillus faecis]|uniref:DUF1273 domain-containing protein n=1 Tax=Ligilactobacillus faecis TaxID=762833 RepID=UPI00246917AE|nr:DUF1273 domain-containing protein [Ligilactobacillus faecis]WGN88990.1 DUF1273 domain-containing protein [Ligilactobacillus faecis]